MGSLKNIFAKFQKGPQDIVGLDIRSDAVAVVRLSRGADGPTVVAADLLPGIESSENAGTKSRATLSLPSKLKAKYAALCLTSSRAVIKLITFPGEFTAEQEEKIIQGLGLENPEDYRVSYKLVTEGRGKTETKVLVAALPEDEAAAAPRLLPTGTPAPFALEVADLAVMTAFLHGPGSAADKAVGALCFGEDTSTLAFFNKGVLSLVRRFPTGSRTLASKVQESLGVDETTAMGILSDGAFDISQAVSNVMAPLLKQMIVSRDFVERRENCKVEALFLSGALAKSNDVTSEIKTAMNMEPAEWNPFESVSVADDALSEAAAAEPWRFATALGTGLGTFEET